MKPLKDLISCEVHNLFPVVDFDFCAEKIAAINLSPTNPELLPEVFSSTENFQQFIDAHLRKHHAKFLIGGYGERREIYRRSGLFDDDANAVQKEEPRNIHLGVDIWGAAGIPVYAPIDATVHSFANNNHFGDYGATIILEHDIAGKKFYTLYGHLSFSDLTHRFVGEDIAAGQAFAHFGPPAENGDWPPHLHFQIIENIGAWSGDYPGVCKTSEKEIYLCNCPDADLLLNLNQYLP